DMRRMLGVLRAEDTLFEPQPGIPDLDELVQAYRAAGLAVRMSTSGPPVPAEAGLQLTVYRVVQESLTNALRHARAGAQVDVLVAHLDGQVVVDVVDDGGVGRFPDAAELPGIGALPTLLTGGGSGIIGMRERAAVYGGSVQAGPYRTGWRVHTVLRTNEEER
ncbi:MAG TPA: ATP-binding protein, partial [Cellulomonas sp.]